VTVSWRVFIWYLSLERPVDLSLKLAGSEYLPHKVMPNKEIYHVSVINLASRRWTVHNMADLAASQLETDLENIRKLSGNMLLSRYVLPNNLDPSFLQI
jgi:hypothetical protein